MKKTDCAEKNGKPKGIVSKNLCSEVIFEGRLAATKRVGDFQAPKNFAIQNVRENGRRVKMGGSLTDTYTYKKNA